MSSTEPMGARSRAEEQAGPALPEPGAARPAAPRPSPHPGVQQTLVQPAVREPVREPERGHVDREAASREAASREAAAREAASREAAARDAAARDAASASAPVGSSPSAAQVAQWAQLQSQFVDDPAAAVKAASGLVEEAVQRVLRRPDGAPDTEALRSAFLRYRDLHRTLSS